MEVKILEFQKLKNVLVLRNVSFQHSEALVTDLISSQKPYYFSPPHVSIHEESSSKCCAVT